MNKRSTTMNDDIDNKSEEIVGESNCENTDVENRFDESIVQKLDKNRIRNGAPDGINYFKYYKEKVDLITQKFNDEKKEYEKRIIELEDTIKKLRDSNITFSDSITRLTDRILKLQDTIEGISSVSKKEHEQTPVKDLKVTSSQQLYNIPQRQPINNIQQPIIPQRRNVADSWN